MASRTKVTVKFDFLKDLKNIVDGATAKQLGETIISESRRFIAVGTSPVLGERRYPAYKNEDRYPGDRKPRRPVNLELTGEMLDSLQYQTRENGIRYGILSASDEVKTRAKANNEGTQHVPARPFIPDKPGQQFNLSIMTKIKDIVSKRLAAIIKQSSRK